MLFASQLHDLVSILPWVRLRRSKQALRALVEQRRRIYPQEQAQADAEAIMATLTQMPCFCDVQNVMLYYPVHNEVDLRPLLQRFQDQKNMLLPITHRKGIEVRRYDGEMMMRRGRFNVPEPQTSKWKGGIDLILVPGVVFDTGGNRIGRGGGYYDRFLRRQHHALKVGIAYDFQVKKQEIPHGHFDQPLDLIITPTQTIGL